MKLPRNLSAEDLIQALKPFGYQVTRQTASHIRLTTTQRGEPHITIRTMTHFDLEHSRQSWQALRDISQGPVRNACTNCLI